MSKKILMVVLSLMATNAMATSTMSLYVNNDVIEKDGQIKMIEFGGWTDKSYNGNALKIFGSQGGRQCIITPTMAHDRGIDLGFFSVALKEGKIAGFWCASSEYSKAGKPEFGVGPTTEFGYRLVDTK